MKITISELKRMVQEEMMINEANRKRLQFKKDEKNKVKSTGFVLAFVIPALLAIGSSQSESQLKRARMQGSKAVSLTTAAQQACNQSINNGNQKEIINLSNTDHISFVQCAALIQTVLESDNLKTFNSETNNKFEINNWTQAKENAKEAQSDINYTIRNLEEQGPGDISLVKPTMKESYSNPTKITLSELKQLIRSELKRSGLV